MIEIRGTFYRHDSDWLPDGAGVYLRLKHDDPSVTPVYYIKLDHGVIPRRERIPANDEIEPAVRRRNNRIGGQRFVFADDIHPPVRKLAKDLGAEVTITGRSKDRLAQAIGEA